MTEPILVTSHVARDFLQNSTYFNTIPKVVWEYVSNSIDNPKLNTPVQVDVSISKERIVIADSASELLSNVVEIPSSMFSVSSSHLPTRASFVAGEFRP